MSWLQLKINTSGGKAEQVSELLSSLGAISVTLQDTYDTPVYEPLPGETKLWGDTDVIGLFASTTNLDEVIASLACHPALLTNLRYQVEKIANQDWERSWMDNFQPIQFGQRLWICPSWHAIPDPHAVNVILDPGLAFGTGSHPTTALCLQWLDQLDLQHKTVIDFGCGSGILAIAALKLGAKQAIGIDIDPQAIEASYNNAEHNGVQDKLLLYLSHEQPQHLSADIVIANILASPLQQLAAHIIGLLKPNGMLCLSGILQQQATNIVATYQSSIRVDPIVQQEEWCRITGSKR